MKKDDRLKGQFKLAEHLFKKWDSSLTKDDKRKESLPSTFESFFYELWFRDMDFEVAVEYLDRAIKTMCPAKSLISYMFKAKGMAAYKTEKEYAEEWKQNINKIANQLFYTYYDPEGVRKLAATKDYGGMTEEEYTKQQRYAYSHPLIVPQNVDIEHDVNVKLDIVLKRLRELKEEEGNNGETNN